MGVTELERLLYHLNEEENFVKRLRVYNSIKATDGFMKKDGCPTPLMSSAHVSLLLNNILSDLRDENEEHLQSFLLVTSQLFSNMNQCNFEHTLISETLERLLEILSITKLNSVTENILKVLESQRFPSSVVNLFIESFLIAIPVTGTAVDGGYVVVIERFFEQCPSEMENHTALWLKTLLKLSCHNEIHIREMSVKNMQKHMTTILLKKKKILALCASFLKTDVLPNLQSLCSKNDMLQEILSAQIPVYMKILGEDCKRSSSLSNSLLKFVEKGFCNSQEKIKLCAFNAWKCLIDCFANNKVLLASPKYCKLLTQPLNIKLKTEALTKALIETMWKLAVCLDDQLPDLFEMLCVPLLEICFGVTTKRLQSRRSSGRLSLTKQLNLYDDIQVLGAEMLCHFLLPPDQVKHLFTLAPLNKPFFGSPAVFARFHSTLMPAVCDTICYISKLLSDDLPWKLWSVVLECTQENVIRKRDTDLFRCLYQSAHKITASNLSSEFLLSIVSSLHWFPTKILNSSLHYTSETPAGAMHGTPIITVLQLLLSPRIREGNLHKTKYLECAKVIITNGMERRIANLEFIRSVVDLLPGDNIVFLKIWVHLCGEVTKYITKTLNINEGDSLEHDFSSLYRILSFPFHFIFSSSPDFDSETSKAIWKAWIALFQQFELCTSKIPSTSPNEARNYIAQQLLTELDEAEMLEVKEPQRLFLESVCLEIVNGATFYPSAKVRKCLKSNKQKKKPSSGDTDLLTGFILTLAKLFSTAEKKQALFPSSNGLLDLTPCMNIVFANLPSSLVKPFFLRCSQLLISYLVAAGMMLKTFSFSLGEAWKVILLRLSYEVSLFEDDIVCDLFSVAFSHSARSIYEATVDFWKMKVLDSVDPLRLPEALRTTLREVYRREDFAITWEDDAVNGECIHLDVSITSDRSTTETEEKEVPVQAAIVSASDVSGEKISDTSAEDDDDITQLDHCSIRNETSGVDDHPSTVSTHEMTSLEESPDNAGLNRSLRLRALAKGEDKYQKSRETSLNSSTTTTSAEVVAENCSDVSTSSSIDEQSSDEAHETDLRDASHQAGDTSDNNASVSTSENESDYKDNSSVLIVDSGDSEIIAISSDNEDVVEIKSTYDEDQSHGEKSASLCNSTSVSTSCRPSSVTENRFEDSLLTNESSAYESSYVTDSSDGDASAYDVVEMAQASMMAEVTKYNSGSDSEIDLSKDNHQMETSELVQLKDVSTVADGYEMDESTSREDENNQTLSSESLLLVEENEIQMVEVSVLVDGQGIVSNFSSASSNNLNSSLKHCYDSEQDDIDECVDMVEMSMQQDACPLESDKVSFSHGGKCEDELFNSKEKSQRHHLEESNENAVSAQACQHASSASDESEYEVVEMGEISVNVDSQMNVSKNDDESVQACTEASTTEHNDVVDITSSAKSSLSKRRKRKKKGRAKPNVGVSTSSSSHFDKPYIKLCGLQTSEKLDSFSECAKDLGVKPLDSSFDSTDNNHEQNIEILERDVHDDVISGTDKSASPNCDFIKDSQVVNDLQENATDDKVQTTPLRRSTRNRVSTPKSVIHAAENGDKTRRKGRRLAVSEDSEIPTEKVKNGDDVFEGHKEHLSEGDQEAAAPVPIETDLSSSCREMSLTETRQDEKASEDDIPAEVEVLQPEGFRDVPVDKCNNISALPETNMMDSPRTSEKEESDEMQKSCLGKRLSVLREEFEVSPVGSPSGILKKRCSDISSPATKSRRVSFAEPISTSTVCSDDETSRYRASSPKDWRKTKISHRLVNRRLSLPVAQKSSMPSPMSIRSASVAAAIADIKARNGEQSPQANSFGYQTTTELPASPKKKHTDYASFRTALSHLQNVTFLRSLTSQQLAELTQDLLETTVVVNSTLVQRSITS